MSINGVKSKTKKAIHIFIMLLIAMIYFSNPSYSADTPSSPEINMDPYYYAYGEGLELSIKGLSDTLKKIKCGFPQRPSTFLSEQSRLCWFCKPMNEIITSMQKLAVAVYKDVIPGLLALMAAGFCLWLVIKILDYIAVAREKSPGDFYSDIGKMTLTVGIAAIVLSVGDGFWNLFILPLTSAVFDYGSTVLGTSSNLSSSGVSSTLTSIGAKMVGSGDTAGGILSAINARIMELLSYGWLMMTAALNSGKLCVPYGHWTLFFFGLTLILFSVIYLFAVPLKFLDIIFRYGLFIVLMPLFVFSWAFPLTKEFATNGIKLFINVIFNLLVFAIVVGLCTKIITSELGLPTISSNDPTEVKDLLIKEVINDWAMFVGVLAYMMFSFLVLNQIELLAGRFSETSYSASSFSSDMHNYAGKPMRAAGSRMAKGTGTAAIAGYYKGKDGIKSGYGKAKQGISNLRNKYSKDKAE